MTTIGTITGAITESANETAGMATPSVCQSAGDSARERMRETTMDDVIGAAFMSVVTVTSVLGNSVLLVVLLRTPSLRFQVSNVFVVNLCVIDLLGAVVVQPVFVASHLLPVPLLDRRLSAAHGCVSCWLMFASILATSAISVERFYSIRLPMHHAAHLTLGRACAVIASYVWFQAGVLAAPPAAYGWSVFLYRYPDDEDGFDDDNGQVKCGTGIDETEYVYVSVASLLCFIVPGVIVVSMYCAIYRVARQAARQVHPGPMRTPQDETLQVNSPGMKFPKEVASANPFNHPSTTEGDCLEKKSQRNSRCSPETGEGGRDDSDGPSHASNHASSSSSGGRSLTTEGELTTAGRLPTSMELLANGKLSSTGRLSDDKTVGSARGQVIFSEVIATSSSFLPSENKRGERTANDAELPPGAEVRADRFTSNALEGKDRSVPENERTDGGPRMAAEEKTKACNSPAADEQIAEGSPTTDGWMQMKNNGHTIPLLTGLVKETVEKAELIIKTEEKPSKEVTCSGSSKYVTEVHIHTDVEGGRGRETSGGKRGVQKYERGYQRKDSRQETGIEEENKETKGREEVGEEVEGRGERRTGEGSTRETDTMVPLTTGPSTNDSSVFLCPASRSVPLPVTICQEELTARHRLSHTKALFALTAILSTFLLLWSPYFIVNLYLSFFFRRTLTPSSLSLPLALRAVEISTRWLGLSASTVNVFVYGWMNRSIRDELFLLASDVRRFLRRPRRGGRHIPSDNIEEANEDFFQFLERTSTGFHHHHHHHKPHHQQQLQSSASSSSSPNYASSSSRQGVTMHRSAVCTTTTSRASSTDEE